MSVTRRRTTTTTTISAVPRSDARCTEVSSSAGRRETGEGHVRLDLDRDERTLAALVDERARARLHADDARGDRREADPARRRAGRERRRSEVREDEDALGDRGAPVRRRVG